MLSVIVFLSTTMRKKLHYKNLLFWTIFIPLMTLKVAFAADCPTNLKAVTNLDEKVNVEILSYRVKPLTKCELEIEAQSWFLLLKAKITEISNAKVAGIYKSEEIKNAQAVEDTLADVKQAKEDADQEKTKEALKEAEVALQRAKEMEKKSVQDD